MAIRRLMAGDLQLRPYSPPQWNWDQPQWHWESAEATITVTPPSFVGEYYVVHAVPKPWKCAYCGTKHADGDSPCCNCGAPQLVYVLGVGQ